MIIENAFPEYPTQFHIEITSQCNLACGFCPVHRVERGVALSRDEITDIIRQISLCSPDYVDFVNYNEPLMCKDFWYYANLITDQLGPGKFGMVTNGTIMSESIADRILALHPKQVIFSVDAFTAETYAKVRPRWTSSGPVEDLKLRDRIYNNINLYLDRVDKSGFGAWPVMEMVVCDHNVHEIEQTRQYWLARLHNQFLVINCTGRGGERAFTSPNDNPCRVILDGLWILSDGRVVACCEDWNGEDCVGDVRKETLLQIWNGKKIKQFRAKHFAGRKQDILVCSKCKTSQDTPNHYKYPDRTNPEILVELRSKGINGS
jgi:radical SAM protein with 4Fe4S-binding SPASM domain